MNWTTAPSYPLGERPRLFSNPLAFVKAWNKRDLRFYAVMVLLAALVYVLFQRNPWLLNVINKTPLAVTAVWLALLVPVLFSARYTNRLLLPLLKSQRRIFQSLDRRPVTATLLIMTISSLLFWYYRIQHIHLGDTYQLEIQSWQRNVYIFAYAPLETLIRLWLQDGIYAYPAVDPVAVYKTLHCIYGGCYVALVLWCAKTLPHPYRWFAPLLMIFSPILQLYCGYLEVYTFPVLIETLYLFAGLFYLQRRISFLTVSAAFGIALAAAGWHVFLSFSFLYLVFVELRREGIKIIQLTLGAIFLLLPVMVTLAFFSAYRDPFGGLAEKFVHTSSLVTNHPAAIASGYTLFSAAHVTDYLNEILFLASPAILVITVLLLVRFKRTVRAFKKADTQFLGVASVMVVSFGFAYYPELGLPRDWDLFTQIFPPITLLGVSTMGDTFRSRNIKKTAVIAVGLGIFMTCGWVLQNALFWNYPTVIKRWGPALSYVVSDFYLNKMKTLFKNNHQHLMYWVADRALEESPGHYKEILSMLDEWTVTILTQQLPRPDDHPGWACDLALDPNDPNRAYIFDKYGRFFMYENGGLQWLFAPEKRLENLIVAGELLSDGSAVMLTKKGEILQLPVATIEQAKQEHPLWGSLETLKSFMPETVPNHALPLEIVDLEIRPLDGHLCVLDNYNRVWDTETGELLLQGSPSYNGVVALRFNQYSHPATIDLNNQLSYDRGKVKLPYQTAWFYPIVRDFLFTFQDEGLLTLDLNGRIHNSGSTALYEIPPNTEVIVDRFIRMAHVYPRDSVLVLDNRYRVHEIKPDLSQANIFSRVQGMIDEGRIAQAYKHLTVYWTKSSLMTSTCYQLIDTEFIRKVRGMKANQSHDSVRMFVDVFPVSDEFFILLDRWGRLVYEVQGNTFLVEGTGLTSFPFYEAVDGAISDGSLYFLCTDGRIWRYTLPLSLQQSAQAYERTPALWRDLKDFDDSVGWVAIETIKNGEEIVALSRNGKALRFNADGKLLETIQMTSTENNCSFMACHTSDQGLAIAYAPPNGPVWIYTSWDGNNTEAPFTKFDWSAIADLIFLNPQQLYAFDKFGRVHPSDPRMSFLEFSTADLADALALRLLPSGEKALWIRTNGGSQILHRRSF